MKKSNQFDIADEIFTDVNEDNFIIKKEVNSKYCKVVETTIKEDSNPFNKSKGLYTSIEFEDIQDHKTYQEVKKYLIKYLSAFVKELTNKKCPHILVVGIGNEEYSPDALGPKVIKKIYPTSHLNQDDLKSKISCLIPGVMGLTGLESFTIVKGVLEQKLFDLLIVIDSLTTNSIKRLNHCIQITDTGLTPGSGVNNYRKPFTKDSLNIPIISIGIATVISLESIYNELLNQLNIDKKAKVKQENNLILTIKEIELRIEVLTSLISDSLNESLNS